MSQDCYFSMLWVENSCIRTLPTLFFVIVRERSEAEVRHIFARPDTRRNDGALQG